MVEQVHTDSFYVLCVVVYLSLIPYLIYCIVLTKPNTLPSPQYRISNMDWGDLAKICRKKPKEIRSLTLRIPFSYKESKTSSSRQLTFKNHSSQISIYGVSKSSRRPILKRTAVTGNKTSSVSTNTVNVTSKTKSIRKRKRLESDEKLEGERVSHFDEFIFVLFCRIYSSPVMFSG